MTGRLLSLLRTAMYALRGGFLVRPLLIAIALGLLGGVLSSVEETVPAMSAWVPTSLFPSRSDPQVAQIILATIAASIMTVVSIVFAILLMTLTLASMQFSPRILLSFVKDRVTQWTLGIFLGTFAYCMAALPAARSLPYPVAPVATVTCAMLLAMICVAWLIFFINHVSQAISVNHIVDRIARETEGVIATSMVSHGVDVNRLNMMVFNGMPKSMAEYIQASSRVGRRYLGIVFMIFNPIRERDRSHFRYHAKFHEYLDRMVEPVAINRWSSNAAKKTLPGVLMAEILQVANRDFWNAGRAPAHLHDLTQMQSALRSPDAGGLESVRPEALLEALGEAYLTDRDEAEELRPELDDRVHVAVDSIRAAGAAASAALGGRSRYRGTGDYLGLEYTPMISLRDIAEGIPFYVLQEKKRP